MQMQLMTIKKIKIKATAATATYASSQLNYKRTTREALLPTMVKTSCVVSGRFHMMQEPGLANK